MYFTQPQQLCDIFAALEKKNLFLIQNVQEIEEQVDDLKQEFKLQKKERYSFIQLIISIDLRIIDAINIFSFH